MAGGTPAPRREVFRCSAAIRAEASKVRTVIRLVENRAAVTGRQHRNPIPRRAMNSSGTSCSGGVCDFV
jgi:hypothetical protein